MSIISTNSQQTNDQQINQTINDVLPDELLKKIFESALADQPTRQTTLNIFLTCKRWGTLVDGSVNSLLCSLYRRASSFLISHPSFNSSNVKKIEMQISESHGLKRLTALSKETIGVSDGFLFPEQYQKLFDDSLLLMWKKICESTPLTGIPTFQDAQAIRAWINNPENAAQIQSIKKLDLNGAGLRLLPPEIGAFVNLNELKLANNQLTTLPPEIGNLSRKLLFLDLSGNKLTTLPEEIGSFENLRTLDLEDNRLTTLPRGIGNLRDLEELDLSNNYLTTLPEETGNLRNLEELDLSNNYLTTLPEGIANLPLRFYDFNHNSFLFLINEKFSAFNNSCTLSEISKKYHEFKNYKPLTSLGMLCQLIHNQADKSDIKKGLTALPNEIQQKIIAEIEQIWTSLPQNQAAENKELLKSTALTAVLHSRRDILVQAITHALRDSLNKGPNRGGSPVDDNIIRFMDDLAKTIENADNSIHFDDNDFPDLSDVSYKGHECKNYEPRTSLGMLCQLIHNQADESDIKNGLAALPNRIQQKIIAEIEQIWTSLPQNQAAENKELLKNRALIAVLHSQRNILLQAIIHVFRESLSEDFIEKIHLRYPFSSREGHEKDNLIRFIDDLAEEISEE